MTDTELTAAAIAASGLSARRFAERIMGRDERTLRYWSSGKSTIPPVARAFMERWLALPSGVRARIVAGLTR